MEALKKREEVAEEQTWSLEDLFVSEEAWEAEYERLNNRLSAYGELKGKLGESAEKLLTCLKLDEETSEALDRLYSYASCKQDEDTKIGRSQERYQRVARLAVCAGSVSAFIRSEILSIPEEQLAYFRRVLPELKRYDRTLSEILRDRPYTRSREVEELLADAAEMSRSAYETFSMLNNADIRFPDVTDESGAVIELTNARYTGLLMSENRDVRREAFQAMYETYGKQKNMLAANFAANVKQAVFFAKARHFSSTRAYYLTGNRIPEEVYDQLIEAVHEALPLMYRYVALRKKVLGLSKLHLYDVYVPLVREQKEKIPFDRAKEWVLQALAPLGEAYREILKEAFENRWIDYAENEGKRSGAYSSGVYGAHPYILMTYKEKLEDVFTLVHELGHSVHSYLSDRAQTYNDSQYRIFVAETASTCNEALLNHYLLAHREGRAQKAYILNHFLDSFKGTLFRQTMFAEFERDMHRAGEEGIPLTAEYLCGEYRKLNERYFGPEMVVDEEIAMEWARIPHFYRPFYVYQYATGFSAAIALSKRILEEGEPAVADYMKFLSGGCTKDPIELLKEAGVDMSRREPVRDAMHVFERYLNQLEELLEREE
ncbi:MAG: oligoendopeptidase F [Lachnospiraceae bacterium]|nr:oligoendopeptidase F [Lachnospiraceae bacterium]